MANSASQDELDRLRAENAELKRRLGALEGNGSDGNREENPTAEREVNDIGHGSKFEYCPQHSLSPSQISRYSRQVLLQDFGAEAQAKLCSSSVLIVGAGGLGSPAALYLAGCGVGRLGIVDKDIVELSNLHRQVIHREAGIGTHKADSAAAACNGLNPTVVIDVHKDGINPANAVALVEAYDCVLDCSDNPATRYLVNDACVYAGRPLVSGAAVGTAGQLSVYHYKEDGPCYRCLFPVAPRPESCSRCSDNGVLGVVPGVIGTLQALEAIKVLSGKGDPLSKKLLNFDALAGSVRTFKMRPRNPECPCCGDAPSLPPPADFDYEQFTGAPANDDGTLCGIAVLPPEQRMAPGVLHEHLMSSDVQPLLVDVRPPHEFSIASLPGAINVPLKQLESRMEEVREAALTRSAAPGSHPVIVICRRGNNSQTLSRLYHSRDQLAVQQLRDAGMSSAVDVRNGLVGWQRHVDPGFPMY